MFSNFSGLKPNTLKYEICGIGVKRGEKVALCGMKSVDLTSEAVKILGIYYSYNEKVFLETNYLEIIKNVENVVSVWRLRNMTLIGKNLIFGSLIMSKVVFLSFLSNVPRNIVEKLENIQYKFLWDGKRAKIKHKTLISSYDNGGLKCVDIMSKIKALQLSWIKRLFDDNEHPWKLIPKYLLNKHYGSEQIFYPNSELKIQNEIPLFYRNIISNWCNLASCNPLTAENVFSQRIWYNRLIKVNNKTIFNRNLSNKGVHNVRDLFNGNGTLKTWYKFKSNFNCREEMYFTFRQIIGALPKT